MEKSLDDFPKSRGNRYCCKICFNKKQKEWRAKNKEKFREYQNKSRKKNQQKYTEKNKLWRKNNPDKYRSHCLKQKHGITLEIYKKMQLEQNNKCFICQKENYHLYVDHCHISNKIRGLLCNNCNIALGLFYDSQDSLQRAIEYLRNSK